MMHSLVFLALLALAAASALEERDKVITVYDDSVKIFHRKRGAHACMMSIVFIILLPLGAISLHLPLKRAVPYIHAPIQILGMSMMIGAMGLGIDMAKNDLHYLHQQHAIIGLLVTSSIILFQPALGILQHRHFKQTGKKSNFGYAHRWIGRVLICLGWINTGLGFQLTGIRTYVPMHFIIQEYVFLGVFGGVWAALVIFEAVRGRKIGEKEGVQATGNDHDGLDHNEEPKQSAL